MDRYFEKLLQLVEQGKLSAGLFASTILRYAKEDRPSLDKLLAVACPQDLRRANDILTTYPHTDVGWSILPLSRVPFIRPELERDEAGDIEHLHYQEDRPHVEFLRDVLGGMIDRYQ